MKLLSRLFLAIAITFFTIEIVCAIYLTFVDLNRGKSLKESLVNRYNDIYLAYNFEPISYGSYEPITQFHPIPNSDLWTQDLRYNKFGFLGNGSDNEDLEIFPGKNNNTFRILLIGGSSALFSPGTSQNTVTIAAVLENKLNKYYTDKSFQVLNFGQVGGWSGNNLVRLSQYWIHLDPDMVIAYNGFNDALLGDQQGDTIINWGFPTKNLYKKYATQFNASDKIQIRRSKLFPFTTSLLNLFFKRLYERSQAEDTMNKSIALNLPFPSAITDYVREKGTKSKSIYTKNMEMMASIMAINSAYFIGLLQPNVAWSLRDKPSQLTDIVGNIDPHIYRRYVNEFEIMKNIYNKSKFTRFVDGTSIVDDFSHDFIYQPDGFHLTPEGNKIIAQEFFTSINSLLPQMTHNPTKK